MENQGTAGNAWDPSHRWDLRVDYLCSEDRKHLSTEERPGSPSQLQHALAKCRAEAHAQKQWASYLSWISSGDLKGPYRTSHSCLMARSKHIRPTQPGYRVTDFSGWVFDLYVGGPDPDAMAQGKHVERHIPRPPALPCHSEWEMIYSDPLTGRPEPLKASCLKIGTGCLWGAPDFVYQHRKTREILIVDRKASNRDISCDGWPNLRAQLWAYSLIDTWRDAPKIHLIGDVWTLWGIKPSHRAVLYWNAEDPVFQAQNRELFEAYGGRIGSA